MSIEISNLTKDYGSQKAVNNISFSVNEGEIVGFLGPNGAGKSTTMKIATGYLPPSSGTVTIAGFDVHSQPIQVKRNTGYLPEHNPLYLDMYVHEYLSFSGSVYGMRGSQLQARVKKMIELCGLTLEQNKKIELLSKGYRQRVGLAQALIHDPKVLILDEPTSGLDPNQILEIRKLIKDVSAHKTVIFSTHILQEVQALCDRVIVINRGEIVADDSLEHILKQTTSAAVIIAEFDGVITASDLGALAQVVSVEEIGPFKFRLTGAPDHDIRPTILRYAAERNILLLGLRQEESSLETIFRDLTKSGANEMQTHVIS